MNYNLAHAAVRAAVLDGRLASLTVCVVCGEPSSVRHHHSYLPEHHLDVVELCDPCHKRVHSGAIPDPATGMPYAGKPYGGGTSRLGRALAAARAERGMSRDDVARAIGVSKHSVYQWERGQRPQAAHRSQIAIWLGRTLADVDAACPSRPRAKHRATP